LPSPLILPAATLLTELDPDDDDLAFGLW